MAQPAFRNEICLSRLSRAACLYEAVSVDIDDQEPTSRDISISSSNAALRPAGKCVEQQLGNVIEGTDQQADEQSPAWWSRVKLPLHRGKLQGWRFGLGVSAIMTTMVLLLNTIFMIWASLQHGSKNGIGTIHTGNCGVVSAWSTGIHLVINALSSALFGASNYTMQCLMAPTRAECDRAHARGEWLDVGVSSFRNLIRIPWTRQLAWTLLALSSLSVHFLYNSAVFMELDDIQIVEFVQAEAGLLRTEDVDFTIFPKQFPGSWNASTWDYDSETLAEWYNKPTVPQLRALFLADRSAFDRLDPQQCIDIYGGDILSGHSHAFAIVDPTVEDTNSVVYPPLNHSLFRSWTLLGFSEADAEATPLYWPSSTYDIAGNVQRDSSDQSWLLRGMPLKYCMAKREDSYCMLQVSMYILLVVVISNLIKTVTMVWYLWNQRTETFVTFGDALASWLDIADESTKGNCLIETKHAPSILKQAGLLPRRQPVFPLFEKVARRSPQKRRWAAGVGAMRWMLSLTLCLLSISAAIVFLYMSNGNYGEHSVQEAFAAGKFFNKDTTSTLETEFPEEGSKGLIASVLLVNTPQIILSCFYLVCNGLLTGMHLAYEYSGYAVDRKGLRVTRPEGAQRSTHWLQLPYKYSLPLLAVSSILHWLISQSLFLVRVAHYRADLVTHTVELINDRRNDRSGVGASLVPLLVSIVLASCMLLAVAGLGFKKLASNMPIAGSCSFALAAATHRPPEDEHASTLPLMWGEIPQMGTQEIGHCSFTSEEVVELEPNREYAGCRLDFEA